MSDETHDVVTLFERENGDPVVKLGEHGDQFRVTDGGFEEIAAVDVVELDEPWSLEELNAVSETEQLPGPIRDHFEMEETDE